jgi:hypothetical protein
MTIDISIYARYPCLIAVCHAHITVTKMETQAKLSVGARERLIHNHWRIHAVCKSQSAGFLWRAPSRDTRSLVSFLMWSHLLLLGGRFFRLLQIYNICLLDVSTVLGFHNFCIYFYFCISMYIYIDCTIASKETERIRVREYLVS